MKRPDEPTDEELAAIREADIRRRQVVLIEAVERAYKRGWEDANKEWTAYADLLEVPAARA